MITGSFSKGYLGAVRWDGVKSNLHLYGAELSKEIRGALKEHGIKGVSVKCKTFSGGQEITVTVKPADGEIESLTDYREHARIKDMACNGSLWLEKEQRYVEMEEYLLCSKKRQEEMFDDVSEWHYKRETSGSMLQGYIDSCMSFSNALKDKIRLINDIVRMYNYEDINSVADYCNTNFYYDIRLNFRPV